MSFSNTGTKPSDLPKLDADGSNIIRYKERVETWLKSRGLGRHLSGRVKRPTAPIDRDGILFKASDSIAAMTDDEIEAYEVALDAWETKESQIRDVVYQTVDASTRMDIKDEPTAHLMWTKLCETYENLGDMATANVLYKLQTARWTKGTMRQHLLDMRELREANYAFLGALAADQDFSDSEIDIPDIPSDDDALASTPERYGGTIVDCGASSHFTPLKDELINYQSIKPEPIRAADGRVFYAEGRGDLKI
ncbi:hypothetical protein BKA70DRAFT_1108939, partial [Coprinopsis sp. MPI-PUGE-AT-0042]